MTAPEITLRRAQFPADQARVAALFRTYESAIGIDLCFQGFADELARLAEHYDAIWLLESAGQAVACVALRRKTADCAELKRLYLDPGLRGQGLGRRLLLAALEAARAAGYRRVILDTIPSRMGPALALYRSLGFRSLGTRESAGHELLDLEIDLQPPHAPDSQEN